MRQTFSCFSKLGGTTNFNTVPFWPSSVSILTVVHIFINLTILGGFFVITRLIMVAANIRKMKKMRFDEI